MPTFPTKNNPLASFMRQPKIYIRLPSNGEFWPKGSLERSENDEYPVYSMTAKDELMLKIPDAVMNGQAVVDVIQNCIPNIKNAWMTPSIDIDVILIALRLATYGELMTTPIDLGGDVTVEHQIDLRIVLDNLLQNITWDPVVRINGDLTIFVRPLNYKHMSETALKTFQTQKIMQVIGDTTISEEEKISAFKESFEKLSDISVGMIQQSVYQVDSSHGSTDNPAHIKEFLENVDKDVFNKIQQHIDKLKSNNEIKPLVIPTPEEVKAKGYNKDTIEVPLVFDPSTFFA